MQNFKKIEISGFPSVAINTNPPPQYFVPRDKCNKTPPFQATQFPRYLDCAQKIRKIQIRSIIVQGPFHPFRFLISISQNAKSANELFIRYSPFKLENDE